MLSGLGCQTLSQLHVVYVWLLGFKVFQNLIDRGSQYCIVTNRLTQEKKVLCWLQLFKANVLLLYLLYLLSKYFLLSHLPCWAFVHFSSIFLLSFSGQKCNCIWIVSNSTLSFDVPPHIICKRRAQIGSWDYEIVSFSLRDYDIVSFSIQDW